jgi:Family of unknown function (DUF5999)
VRSRSGTGGAGHQAPRHCGARPGRERFHRHRHLRVAPTATPARTVFAEPALNTTGPGQTKHVRSPRTRGTAMCPHRSRAPPSRPPGPRRRPHHRLPPEQGWSLLCNGVIMFDDMPVPSPHTSLPLACDPGRNRILGLSLSSAPHRAGPGNARQGGDRPGHGLDYVPGISQPPSTYSLTTCDLTSHDWPVICAGHGTPGAWGGWPGAGAALSSVQQS